MKTKILILVAVSVLTFGNTLFNDFIWDDIHFLRDDPYIKIESPWFFLKPDYWLKHFRGTPGRFRPLRSILFSFEYKLWGLRPMYYHLVNIILHTTVVVMIYLFLKRWVFVGDSLLPFLTALIFAVHPVHVESVAWIKNCTDLLCMIFLLLSFHFFLMSTSQDTTLNSKILRVFFYVVAIIFYVISILAKEMGVTLPFVIFAYLWIVRDEKNIFKNLIKLSGYFVLLLAVFIYKVFVLEPEAPLTVEVSFIIKTFGEYLAILLFPFNLCAERQLNKVESFFEPTFLFGLFGVAIILILWKYKKEIRFSLSWLIITMLPVLNIIYLEGRPLAEQRMYIPSLGFCIFLSYFFAQRWFQKYTTKILFMLLILVYGVIAVDRNFDWRDPVTFWEKTLYQTGSPRAFLNLGEAYLQIGDDELGIRVSKQAVRSDSTMIGALANIGIGYMKLGEKEKAIEYFIKALTLQPNDANNYVNLGVALLELKRYDEAKRILEKGLQIDDYNANLHLAIGNLYAQLGRYDIAAQHFKKAMVLAPDLKLAEINYKQALKDLEESKKSEWRLKNGN